MAIEEAFVAPMVAPMVAVLVEAPLEVVEELRMEMVAGRALLVEALEALAAPLVLR